MRYGKASAAIKRTYQVIKQESHLGTVLRVVRYECKTAAENWGVLFFSGGSAYTNVTVSMLDILLPAAIAAASTAAAAAVPAAAGPKGARQKKS